MQTMQNTAKQNYHGLVASYNMQPGNEMDLFYNTPEPTRNLTMILKVLWFLITGRQANEFW